MGTRLMTAAEAFDEKASVLDQEPERVAGLAASYWFELAGENGGVWTLNVDDGKARITRGAIGEPDVTVQMEAVDFVRMCSGQLDGHEAFMSGRLRVTGSLELAVRLEDILG